MAKRNNWDNLNRQKKAAKAPYRDRMKRGRLYRMPSDVMERLLTRREERLQKLETANGMYWRSELRKFQISPEILAWLRANQFDERRVLDATKSAIGALCQTSWDEESKRAELLQTKPMLFFQFNSKVRRAVDEIGSIALLDLPSDLKQWLTKFRIKTTPQ
jgi:hypothetical protein